MAKQYDVSIKHLLEPYAADWVAQFGITNAPVEPIDADLSTVSAQADKLFRVLEPDPWVLHLEIQAGPDRHLDTRTLRYNVLGHERT